MVLSNIKIKKLITKYFPDLKEKEIDIFLSISKYQYSKSKELILQSGKNDKNLIFILKGVARAYSINEKGQELNNYLRGDGKLMADAKIFGDEIQTLNIESIGKIHYLKFDIIELEKLGFNNPDLMNFYLNFLKEIILTLSYRLNTFVAMTPKERYEDLISWNPNLIDSVYDKHISSFLGIKPLTFHRIKKTINKSIN